MLVHARVQHPVGHGFFHTARVSYNGLDFRYVYDCGGSRLQSSIKEFINDNKANADIGALFLSHFHHDHVNGLDYLLPETDVDTVVIPYVNHQERLLLALDALEIAGIPGNYFRFLENPSRWLFNRGVRRVIRVQGFDPDEFPPANEIPPPLIPPELPSLSRLKEIHNEKKKIHLKIKRMPEEKSPDAGEDMGDFDTKSPPDRFFKKTISHNQPMLLYIGGYPVWLLLTFVQQAPNSKLSNFYKDFKRVLNSNYKKLLNEVNRRKLWASLLADRSVRKDFRQAYSRIFHDINRTSLCLYSGRGRIERGQLSLSSPQWRWYLTNRSEVSRYAWLGTGDALLSDNRVTEAFRQHYAQLLSSVSTMSLPHHGSSNNYSTNFFESVMPFLAFSTSRHGSEKHPSSYVLEEVEARGTAFLNVTEKRDSALKETIRIDS